MVKTKQRYWIMTGYMFFSLLWLYVSVYLSIYFLKTPDSPGVFAQIFQALGAYIFGIMFFAASMFFMSAVLWALAKFRWKKTELAHGIGLGFIVLMIIVIGVFIFNS